MSKRGLPAASGALAGIINGLFGAGGGAVLTVLLQRPGGLEPKRALATSLSVLLPVSLISAAVLWQEGELQLREALPYIIGALPGGWLAGRLLQRLPARPLQLLFGLLLACSGARALLA